TPGASSKTRGDPQRTESPRGVAASYRCCAKWPRRLEPSRGVGSCQSDGGASMRRIGAALGLVAILLTASASAAAVYSQETLDQRSRIGSEVPPGRSGWVVTGYVYGQYSGLWATHMQLAIERLDATGQVIGPSTTWVLGEVPPNNRAYFTARVEPAASYRV